MVKVGDRIRLSSGKGPDRDGTVIALAGSMVRVRWGSAAETTIIPAPGTLTVLASSGDQAPARAVGKKANGKKAVGKKAVGKKAVGKKAVGKKAVGKKAVGKKAVGKKAVARKAAAGKATTSKRSAGKKGVGKRSSR